MAAADLSRSRQIPMGASSVGTLTYLGDFRAWVIFQIFSQPPGDTFTEHNIGGYLAGVGSNSASPGTWILTSPVSEPSEAALLACGILVLVGLSFRTFLVRVAGIEEFRFREGRMGARISLH